MMDLQQIMTINEQRNQLMYNWLRWLVVLAAGCFAALLSFLATKTLPASLLLLLKVALTCQAVGILLGSIALYGEIVVIRGLLKAVIGEYNHIAQEQYAHETNGVSVFLLPTIYRVCEKCCYAFLLLSLLCLVILVWLL